MQFLEEDPVLCESIEKQVRNKLSGVEEETPLETPAPVE